MLEVLRNTWRHWDLVLSFTLRDIKARYKQTSLGVAWAIVQPLSIMVVFTLVFSVFAKVPSDGLPYPIFAYSGLIFWTFFANSLTAGTLAMVANSPLIRKIYFPRETLLVSVLLAATFDLAIALLLFRANVCGARELS
jgi:lipopolysaccharide transport system permease protein